ncbi:adenosylcobinamide-GDP ribazoletransferase [Jeotgalibacillus sp. ET6]|uniref:adenosylcobinamide-GDP ribazoletransferase n=1 Tax=Jeotgalibacillus sp. ET6 TaxID=3037260 RepID=UPI0024188C2C|nr:adenosylcobinamide-GDP ribazoletransferase [Jeotgalibacillus sp. ET6]MDG5471139.1 adenosylcobinamide-GDP ribazoletransferase [Jeotgalibacillus sp. ET6]
MKNAFKGLMLAFQFFTVVPITKEIELSRRTVPWMIGMLPTVGLVIGWTIAGTAEAAESIFSMSPLMKALLVWVLFISWSGGLHLDGWTDASDAYFSYSSPEKRVEILKDPHVGAFGVLSLVVLLAAKGVLFVDLFSQFEESMIWLIWIPILSRVMMAVLLTAAPLAKEEGIAYYLRQSLYPKHMKIPLITGAVALLLPALAFGMMDGKLLILLMAGFLVFSVILWHFAVKQFGGINGDLLGAGLEGGELWSILLVWSYLSIVTG